MTAFLAVAVKFNNLFWGGFKFANSVQFPSVTAAGGRGRQLETVTAAQNLRTTTIYQLKHVIRLLSMRVSNTLLIYAPLRKDNWHRRYPARFINMPPRKNFVMQHTHIYIQPMRNWLCPIARNTRNSWCTYSEFVVQVAEIYRSFIS